jgi:hypothetical protein
VAYEETRNREVQRMKFVATIKIVYDVNPDHYLDENGDRQDVEKMLALDRANLESEPQAFLDFENVNSTLEEWAGNQKD